jgi:hypothetical protein
MHLKRREKRGTYITHQLRFINFRSSIQVSFYFSCAVNTLTYISLIALFILTCYRKPCSHARHDSRNRRRRTWLMHPSQPLTLVVVHHKLILHRDVCTITKKVHQETILQIRYICLHIEIEHYIYCTSEHLYLQL